MCIDALLRGGLLGQSSSVRLLRLLTFRRRLLHTGKSGKVGLVDSSVIIDYDNGYAVNWWEQCLQEGKYFVISVISVMEFLRILSNIEGSRQNDLQDLKYRLEVMLNEGKIIRILPITESISRRACELVYRYCEQKTPSAHRDRMQALICDMLIAATALEWHLIVYTKNRRDFEWIEGLGIDEPQYDSA